MADEGLTAGAVARRLGVAVTTLRTWHQRYGLGPNLHVSGQHRRYTPQDVDRLEVMRRLTTQGVSPAEAAAWARHVTIDGAAATPQLGHDVTIDQAWPSIDVTVAAFHDTHPPPTGSAAAPPRPRGRDGGGNAIPTGRAGPAARGLARAAVRLDAPALRSILEREVAARGVVDAWEQVIMPVLLGIGERYEVTGRFIDVEHLTSRSISEVLGAVPRPDVGHVPLILLACADEDQHTLPLEALAAALAERHIPSRLLGARVPWEALADAVARTGPSVVVIWAQLAQTADPTLLTRLLLGPHRPLMAAAAGPGWAHRKPPPGVPILGSLAEAVQIILAVVQLPGRVG